MPAKDKQVLQDSRSEDLRRRGEAALRESEERFRIAAETSNDLIYEWDLKQNLQWPDKIDEMLGYGPGEFSRTLDGWVESVHPEDIDHVKASIEAHLQGRVPYVEEYRIRRKDGVYLWWSARGCTSMSSPDGTPVRWIGTVTDITARKQAEEALRLEKEVSEKILGNIPVMIAFLDVQGKHQWVNQCWQKTLGWSMEEAQNRDILTDLYPNPEYRGYVIDFIAKAPGSWGDFKTRARSGVVLDTSWANVALVDGSNIGIGVDITERKQAEEALVAGYEKIKHTFSGLVKALSATVETRDPYTAGHQQRVAHLAGAISQEMGLSQEQCKGMQVLGLLHDIGKMVVPAEILSKPGKISEIEFSLIKSHPQVGYDILKDLEFPWPIAQAVLQHHERLDGSGYPQGLTGSNITLCARILAVTDVVEAMASHRPYRAGLGIDQALEEITKNKGILYEPEVVDACVKLFTEKGFKFEA